MNQNQILSMLLPNSPSAHPLSSIPSRLPHQLSSRAKRHLMWAEHVALACWLLRQIAAGAASASQWQPCIATQPARAALPALFLALVLVLPTSMASSMDGVTHGGYPVGREEEILANLQRWMAMRGYPVQDAVNVRLA